MIDEIPSWISVRDFERDTYLQTRKMIEERGLSTVCIEANCPNRYECFSDKAATFMILGDVCTRDCRYCNVRNGEPKGVDGDEPSRVAFAVRELGLRYAVITCVTRDDLSDGGAEHFMETIRRIREVNPGCKVEALISDLAGNWEALDVIVREKPDVLNHNIEVVRGLFPKLRPKGDFERSLLLLSRAKDAGMVTKSGLMVGLGEKEDEIWDAFLDLKRAGCDIITVGQYLRPGPDHAEVKRYYSPQEFMRIQKKAIDVGFWKVVAGPLVRSSYHAGRI